LEISPLLFPVRMKKSPSAKRLMAVSSESLKVRSRESPWTGRDHTGHAAVHGGGDDELVIGRDEHVLELRVERKCFAVGAITLA
jgi:hypothetical protein